MFEGSARDAALYNYSLLEDAFDDPHDFQWFVFSVGAPAGYNRPLPHLVAGGPRLAAEAVQDLSEELPDERTFAVPILRLDYTGRA